MANTHFSVPLLSDFIKRQVGSGLGFRFLIAFFCGFSHGNRSGQRFEQLGGFDLKCVREGNDIQERDVALASLHPTHVITMQARQFSELLLREPSLEPEPSHVHPERGSGVGSWHAASLNR
jgi:hypothetical protein